jgi:hypothetical protein
MIKDAKGRKWAMRFKQYQEGWLWEARWKNNGQSSGVMLFETKALAEDDARRRIQGRDAIALTAEYFRRLERRGSVCQLTATDHAAIARAGGTK